MMSNWETQESKMAPYAGSYNYPNANAQSDMGMKNRRNKGSKGEKIAGSKFNQVQTNRIKINPVMMEISFLHFLNDCVSGYKMLVLIQDNCISVADVIEIMTIKIKIPSCQAHFLLSLWVTPT